MAHTRRDFIRRSALTAGTAVWLAGHAAPAPATGDHRASGDERYWAAIDAIAPALDPLWSEVHGRYVLPELEVHANALLLTTHAIAARHGHAGPSRRDERARILAARFASLPSLQEAGRPGARGAIDPWLDTYGRPGYVFSVDAKVAEALAYAFRAREALGLAADTVAAIAARLSRDARSRTFAYPSALRNQINWNADVYAAAAVTGDPEPLRTDYRRHLRRFASAIVRPVGGDRSPYLGPGYRFIDEPARPALSPVNLDSAEYANLTVHALIHYEEALRAGMAPLPRNDLLRLRAWVQRLVSGSWTHAGYLNWDTGRGRDRWHWGRYWAAALPGLLTVASATAFQPSPEYAPWARHLLGRALDLYARLAVEQPGGLAPASLFGTGGLVRKARAGDGDPGQRAGAERSDRVVFAARIQVAAARAIDLGITREPAQEPPPLYAFDPDTGRLAVTTPAYSTAIVPDPGPENPYGGVEPARLFDGWQRPVGGIGGAAPAAFGLVVREGTRTLLATQDGGAGGPGRLRLARSPRGVVKRTSPPYPRPPYAGPFTALTALARAERAGVRVDVEHAFDRSGLTTRWVARAGDVPRGGRRRPLTVDVFVPTWASDAPRTGGTVRLASVVRFHVRSAGGGYVVEPRGSRPPGAVARAVAVRPSPGAWRPGPSLQITLGTLVGRPPLALALRLDVAVPHT
jgi:hypothetical protein